MHEAVRKEKVCYIKYFMIWEERGPFRVNKAFFKNRLDAVCSTNCFIRQFFLLCCEGPCIYISKNHNLIQKKIAQLYINNKYIIVSVAYIGPCYMYIILAHIKYMHESIYDIYFVMHKIIGPLKKKCVT
jgi:hypothetical protein